MRKSALIAASLSLMTVASARAQSIGDVAAYAALNSTPAGAMSSSVSNAQLGSTSTANEFAFRYGHMSQNGSAFNAYGVSASMPLSGFTVGGTVGYQSFDCTGCNGNMMLGLNAENRFATMPMSSSKGAPSLNFGARADFGWANPSDGLGGRASALAFSADVPVTLVAKNGNYTIAPYVTPGLGYGRMAESGQSESGQRFMVGAGLGLMNRNGWGVSAGMRKVFINQGASVFGLNISYGK